MSWRPVWTEQALKDAERLDARVRERVVAAVERHAANEHGDVKRLRGREREWRLRVGDWRVLFAYDHDAGLLLVLRVLPPARAYR